MMKSVIFVEDDEKCFIDSLDSGTYNVYSNIIQSVLISKVVKFGLNQLRKITMLAMCWVKTISRL